MSTYKLKVSNVNEKETTIISTGKPKVSTKFSTVQVVYKCHNTGKKVTLVLSSHNIHGVSFYQIKV